MWTKEFTFNCHTPPSASLPNLSGLLFSHRVLPLTSTLLGSEPSTSCKPGWVPCMKLLRNNSLSYLVKMASRNPASQRRITAVIFDMDGLLLNTEDIYTKVTQKILEPYGKQFTWSIKVKMMGRRAPEAAQVLIDELGLQEHLTASKYLELREEYHKIHWPQSELLPGVEALVSHLHNHNIPMAVATSSHREAFDLKIMRHQNVFCCFRHVVTGDDKSVKAGKPAPDIFLEAAKRLGVNDPSQCLVFEDAPAGVQAARNAAMNVVAVPHPENDQALFQHADEILSSLEHFDPSKWSLPPFVSVD